MMRFIALLVNLYGLIEANWMAKFIVLSMLEHPIHLFKDNFSQRADGVGSAGVPEVYERPAGVALGTPAAGNRVL